MTRHSAITYSQQIGRILTQCRKKLLLSTLRAALVCGYKETFVTDSLNAFPFALTLVTASTMGLWPPSPWAFEQCYDFRYIIPFVEELWNPEVIGYFRYTHQYYRQVSVRAHIICICRSLWMVILLFQHSRLLIFLTFISINLAFHEDLLPNFFPPTKANVYFIGT